MSFLFHKRTTSVLQWIWRVLAVIIIVGMVLFFSEGAALWLVG